MSNLRVLEQLGRKVDATTYQEIREMWKRHAIAEDAHDLPGLLGTLTEDCVYEIVQTADKWTGHAGAAEFYKSFLGALPDVKFDLTNIVIGPQGVFEEVRIHATHEGPFLGRQPTGRKVSCTAVIFFGWNVKDRKFTGERISLDVEKVFGGVND